MKYPTIKKSIRDAVVDARRHGVTKENFVIDIRDAKLTPKLKSQLSQYNRRIESGKIRRLWVLSAGGSELTEITLA